VYPYRFAIQTQMVVLMEYSFAYEKKDYRNYSVVHPVLLEFLV
jgi:5-methylcytosine-specific restriction endonuclease McrBC regulatory subunit McrC